jgi:hypothetical protein
MEINEKRQEVRFWSIKRENRESPSNGDTDSHVHIQPVEMFTQPATEIKPEKEDASE